MKPFYQNARITLYCGDSLEVLASLMADGIHFDLMLTDPPYGLNQKENKPSGVNAQRAKGAYKDDLFFDTEEYLNAKVRPVIDIGLAISDLGIVTGGVGSWKYLPPPPRGRLLVRARLAVIQHMGTPGLLADLLLRQAARELRGTPQAVARRHGARLRQPPPMLKAAGFLEEASPLRDGRDGRKARP